MADVVVLADFYQLLPALGKRIEQNLKAQWGSDSDVVENTAFYLGFSEMLQSQDCSRKRCDISLEAANTKNESKT